MGDEVNSLTKDLIQIAKGAALLSVVGLGGGVFYTQLTGCSAKPSESATGIAVTSGGGGGEVQDLVTKAGVRCVALIGYYKGAISCDWNHASQVERVSP